MDREHLKYAHPSFPILIRQLSADEAKILDSMFKSAKHPRVVQRFDLSGTGLAFTCNESNELAVPGLTFPENIEMYTDRLQRLGLIKTDVEKPMEPIFTAGKQTGGRNFFVCKFTEFGSAFMRACGS